MKCKRAGLIDVGVSAWYERRKGQKRKRLGRERRRWIKGSRSVERRRERWKMGRGIGKRKGKGSADVGEGYTLRTYPKSHDAAAGTMNQ